MAVGLGTGAAAWRWTRPRPCSLGNALTDRAGTRSSDDPVVATVDSNGLVRGKTGGSVEIAAVVDNVKGTPTVEVVATAPDVETRPTLNVDHRRAQLRAVVNPNGAPTTARFDWSTDPDLSDPLSTDPVSLGSAGVEQAFSTTVSGLSPGTRYYFRVVATNDVGSAEGEILAFDTPDPQAPSVETLPATDVGTNSATLHGSVNPNGSATTAWFEWADRAGNLSQAGSGSVGNGSADVEIDVGLDSLAPESTYHFWVVASNDVGTSQGATLSFRTRIPPPSGLSGGFDGGLVPSSYRYSDRRALPLARPRGYPRSRSIRRPGPLRGGVVLIPGRRY